MADGKIIVKVNARADEVGALVAEVKRLRAELQYARDGLTKGRTRMREDIERLRAQVAAERERCAHACEDEARLWEADGNGPATEARLCAARIRALGPTSRPPTPV